MVEPASRLSAITAAPLGGCPVLDEAPPREAIAELIEHAPASDQGRCWEFVQPVVLQTSLQTAIDCRGLAVADYATDANSLDLGYEVLVADPAKPYAHLFERTTGSSPKGSPDAPRARESFCGKGIAASRPSGTIALRECDPGARVARFGQAHC